jgi:hypothetical protein
MQDNIMVHAGNKSMDGFDEAFGKLVISRGQ